MSISYKGFVFKAQYHKGQDRWYIKYVPSSNFKSVGQKNKASFNVGAYKNSDSAKADFTRLANHLISGKYHKTFEPALEELHLPALVIDEDDDDDHNMAIVPTETQTGVFSPASPGLVSYSIIVLVTRVSYTFFVYI